MKPKKNKLLLALLGIIFLSPVSAYAHTGMGHTVGFANGFGHPFGGLDHILAMIAVGIWAFQTGGKAVWAVPTAFVGVMALGSVLGVTGVTVPFTEEGIIISVLLLGVLIAASVRMPLAISMVIVGLFAVFHGHAHGAEMPVVASGLAYGVGFVVSTALLHLCGIGIGVLFQKTVSMRLIRYTGASIATAGVCLFLA